jgi:FYVE zinc finger
MSSTQSSSSSTSTTGSDSESLPRRPSIYSATRPGHTMSSNSRPRDPLPRTSSDRSDEYNQHHLTTRRMSRLPSQDQEQTVSEFLRENSERQPVSGADISTEAKRQTLMAMDRKRRLTQSGRDGRRRTTNGAFHERGSSDQSLRFDVPSSHRRQWPERGESSDHPLQVIDLTGSSPIATPAPLSLMPPPLPPPAPPQRENQHATSRTSSSSSRRYTVPRWQNDAEVQECPICGRSFSFLFRRHHCRKCGRVVCNDCSPHRIAIPRSLIVNPPGLEMSSSPTRSAGPISGRIETVDLTGDGDSTGQSHAGDSSRSDLGGAAKVRLCNPCVPDPQPVPQDDYSLPISSLRSRSHKNTDIPSNSSYSGHLSGFFGPSSADFIPRRTDTITEESGRIARSDEGENSQVCY